MKPTQFPREKILAKISRSSAFHTYQHLFTGGFGLPLFLESEAAQPATGVGDRRSPFCVGIHPGSGACASCPLHPLPPLDSLAGTWNGACAANLRVAAVPVMIGDHAAAWLVTGHTLVAGGGKPSLVSLAKTIRRTGLGSHLDHNLLLAYRRTPRMADREWQRATRFLEFVGVFLGSQLNSILISGDPADSPETDRLKRMLREPHRRRSSVRIERVPGNIQQRFQQETGMPLEEFDERCRLELARRELLARSLEKSDMQETARRAGWESTAALGRAFERYFHESPAEHWQRISRCDRALSPFGD